MSHHSLFDTQRAMRAQRQAALRRGVVAVLDIGSWKVSCLVLAVDADRQDSPAEGVGSLVGHGAFRIVGAATTRSRGVEVGEVTSMEETERAIRTAVVSAQKMAGVRADHVIACLSGAAPRSYGLVGEVTLNGEVTEQDIGAVLAACDVPDYGAHREAIHALPVNFSLDHRTGARRSAGPDGPPAERRHAPFDGGGGPPFTRCWAACNGAIWRSPGSPARPMRLAWRRSLRMNRSWARPAST